MRITPGETAATRAGAVVSPSSSRTPCLRLRSAPGPGTPLSSSEVLLLHTEARVSEQLCESAVVGQHEQSLGLAIETSD